METVAITLTGQDMIFLASLFGAVGVILKYLFSIHDKIQKYDAQEVEIQKLAKHHEDDMSESREERQLMVYGILACLKGLKEQGCNGPVTEAINKFEKHLNKKAHE